MSFYKKVNKNFKRKTLVDEIKSILQQYPDDGQIFKEIIQNADDAGATEVVFVYDHNDDRNKLKLSDEFASLQKHQGPSLFAYNDACFDEDDWDGIRSLGISKKVHDGLKVGRFGLGFKSVFHLTDLPCVTSGSTFAYLNPLEETPGKEVSSFELDPNSLEYVQQYDDFKAYHRLGTKFWKMNNSTDGTVFRFALRQEKSSLSSVCYTRQTFTNLMEKFMNEGYLTLIFLKHVRSIKVFNIEENSKDLKEVYSVEVSENCQRLYGAQKQKFAADITTRVDKKSFRVEEKLDHELELVVSRRGERKLYKYAVCEMFGFVGKNDEFVKMMTDEDLSYVPLIAIAYPLENNDDPGGHIFSGLPIPFQSRCMNGMPVHVNGFFALGQDRKDLKWKTLSTDSSNDKTVNWNIHLITELLPVVYSNLIKFLIQNGCNSADIYKVWPVEQRTDPKWRMFLKTFYNKMLDIQCVYVAARRLWYVPNSVMFSRDMTKDQFDAVEQFFTPMGNVAMVPEHITTSLGNVSWVTKTVIQNKMRSSQQAYLSLSTDQKCLLLSYTVETLQDLQVLNGLSLFQLVNGNYFSLQHYGHTSYFIPTPNNHKELLPSLDRVIDVNFFTANSQFLEKLKNICSGMNIVVLSNTNMLIGAVRESLPYHWRQPNLSIKWPDISVNSNWLPGFTLYRQTQNINFYQLEGVPYILIEKGNSKELMKISKENAPMMTSDLNGNLSNVLKKFLQNCGICFVDQSMKSQEIQNLYYQQYVLPADSQNILNELKLRGRNILQHFQSSSELRSEFSKLIIAYNGELPQFCHDLPIFKAFKREEYFSSRVSLVVNEIDIPPEWNTAFANIVRKQDADERLRMKLQLNVWSFEQVSTCVIGNLHRLTDHQQISFFQYILNKSDHYYGVSMQFISLLSNCLKIKDDNGISRRPCELFEKTPKLESFFTGEQGKFPADNYNMNALKRFGLKTAMSVKVNDVNNSISVIQRVALNSYSLMLKKIDCILRIIKENKIEKSLLARVSWIPIAPKPSSSYPINLKWFGSSSCGRIPVGFEKVENVYIESCQDLVGSLSYIIHPSLSELVVDYIKKTPTVSEVVSHLNNVESSYSDGEKRLFYQMVIKIYKFLSQNQSEVLRILPSMNMKVWHGNGFAVCEDIAITKVQAVCDLSPYYYVPPAEVLAVLKPILDHMKCSQMSEFDIYIDVLQRLAKSNDDAKRSSQDWALAFPIVKYLAKNYQSHCEGKKSQIFVPVEAKGLHLQSLDRCFYHNFGENVSYSVSQSKNFILHHEFGKEIASKFKIPNLVSKVLRGNQSKLFKAWGQSEPLTLRLKKLLEDYQDGLAIVKELIQNADDAGAKQVKFLYDQRRNENLKSYLIDTKMEEWQGPALWIYNDQQFSEEDFENITKLNAGTKELDTATIGKFGLGFNSVYHLTDVPSFLSGESLVIFDPHMSYLGEALGGQKDPGLRITTIGEKGELSQFRDQFAVYNGVFGAQLDHDNPFNGTLFRLPLRMPSTSARSEIKKKAYDHREMELLLQKFKESLSTIILFMKNVKSVHVYELNEYAKSPCEQKLSFSVDKEGEILSSNIGYQDIVSAANDELKKFPQRNHNIPSQYLIEKIAMNTTIQNETTFESWLNFSTIGSKETYRFAVENKGHLPCGGISVKFENKDGIIKLTPIDIGQIFCFLPLPIPSCVPMHINGAFAISKDRQSLQFHSKDDKTYGNKNWNDLLATDIGEAYYQLLVYLKELCPQASFSEFLSCFPTAHASASHRVSHQMLRKVIERILYSNDEVIPTRQNNVTTWIGWSQLRFPDFQTLVTTSVFFMNCYYKISELNYVCVDLPKHFKELLNAFGFAKELEEGVITKKYMFGTFLNCIEKTDLEKKVRNEILESLLDEKPNGDLRKQMEETACIPTLPSGVLRKPSELVIKGSKVAELYTEQDDVFPDLKEKHFDFLHSIGANKDKLPWSMLAERARAIEALQTNGNHDDAHAKSKILLSLIEISNSNDLETDHYDSLVNSKFMKVLQKPKDDIFSTWFGSGVFFSSPNKMFLNQYKDVCSCSSLLCEDQIEKNAMKILKFDRLPSAKNVIVQVNELAHVFQKQCDLYNVHNILEKTYDLLSKHISNKAVMQKLKEIPFVRTDNNQLVRSSEVFLGTVKTITGFVHTIDSKIKLKPEWENLMVAIDVEENATVARYQEAMLEMKLLYNGKPLSDDHLEEIIPLINHLCSDDNFDKIVKSNLVLPDSKGILQEFDRVCYKDLALLPDEEGVLYIHDLISRSIVEKLEVKSLGADLFLKNANTINDMWIPFGQSEALSTRIRNLLQGYSERIDVFKEMFQNADDAGATEIEFILDKRKYGEETVFSEKWTPLQGAAVLVINNGHFNESDLKGIQALGDGSKQNDPLSTGKYGVGFNSVYRITDCPVLLTKIENMGDVMAIFDPLNIYAEGASRENPGTMMKDAREFLKSYPDVMETLLFKESDHCVTINKTLFRLPLRKEKSKISEETIKTEQVESIMRELEKKIDYFLLFMRNIDTVKLRIINEDGKQVKTSYRAHSYGTSKKKVNEFKSFTNNYANKLGNPALIMNSERKLARTVCIKKIKDDKFQSVLHWDVVEQCGFSDMTSVPIAVLNMIEENKLHLLPKGGIAKKSKETSCENCDDELKEVKDIQRICIPDANLVFCTLPLAVDTEIPMIVNGSFILNYETRRDLWSNHTGLNRDWNNAILKHIVVPCYLNYLENMTEDLGGTFEVDEMLEQNTYSNKYKDKETSEQNERASQERAFKIKENKYREICLFYNLFPKYANKVREQTNQNLNERERLATTQHNHAETRTYWDYLAREFYCMLDKKQLQLLAILKKEEVVFYESKKFLHYCSMQSVSSYRSLENIKLLQTLKDVFVNADILPTQVSESFNQVGCKLTLVSPKVIREQLVDLKDKLLPQKWEVQKTVFNDISNVETLLKYCLKDLKAMKENDEKKSSKGVKRNGNENQSDEVEERDGQISLENLPLCVRADNTMQCFSTTSPVYNTKFNKLIKGKDNLFLHKKIQKILTPTTCFREYVDQGCFKTFSLIEFSNLLAERLGQILKNNLNNLEFKEAENHGVTWEWISSVWKYIHSEIKNKENERKASEKEHCTDGAITENKSSTSEADEINLINDWSLVIAKSIDGNFLFKISSRKAVLHMGNHKNRRLVNVLRKVGVFEPVLQYTKDRENSVKDVYPEEGLSMFGSADSLYDLTNALVFAYEHRLNAQNALSIEDTEELLTHLESLLNNADNTAGNNNNEACRRLKPLPIFAKWDGDITNGEGLIILSPEFLVDGLGTIETRCKVKFVKHSEKFERVYKALDFQQCSFETMCNYFFNCVDEFTDEEIKVHVRNIRNCNRHMDYMIEKMKFLKMFKTTSGERRLCSEMYDPSKEIFELMGTSREFPAKEYCTDEWFGFLKMLGLITELTDQDFLRFAQALREESDLRKVENGSKLLCSDLYHDNIAKKDININFYIQLSEISFLIPYKIEKNLEEVQKSRNSSVAKICFKNSIIPKQRLLIWTTEFVLPEYATPQYYGSRNPSITKAWKDVACKLGVKSKANSQTIDSLDYNSVLENIKTVTNSSEHLELQTASCKYIKHQYFVPIYQSVFYRFYNYLNNRFKKEQNSCLSQTLKASLENISCIYINGQSIEIPSKVLLRDDKVLYPYLSKVHESLGQFFNVLEKIGCSSTASSKNYICLFQEVKGKVNERSLEPNEIDLVKKAVVHLNTTLQQQPATGFDDQLFLPTVTFVEKETVKLTNSTDCFYVDDFSVEDRLQDFDQPLLIHEYGEGNYNINKQLVEILPSKIRPFVLSECIKESLVHPLHHVKPGNSHVSSKIKYQLTSQLFHAGLIRLANHGHVKNINLDLLKHVKVHVLKTIKTQFTINDQIIKSSELEKKIFADEDNTGLSIYFHSTTSDKNATYSEVAKALLQNILKDLNDMGKDILYAIPELLSITPDKISKYLDDSNIRREVSKNVPFNALGDQRPGDPVPIELHGLLQSDLSAFRIGEYVGIDRDGDGETFFYGVIRTLDNNTDVTSRVYGVQTTPDESLLEQIPFCMIYKFNREYEKELEEELQIMKLPNESQNDAQKENDENRSFEEIVKEISTVLKNLKDKDEVTRKATIRRLYLTWHPDKHPEKTQALATEVFKFIQNELKKLDDGYEKKFEQWNDVSANNRAQYEWYEREYRKYQREFQRNRPTRDYNNNNSNNNGYFYTGGYSNPPPQFTTENPQPSEAKRWFKQAKYDLETAMKLSTPSYEWVCQMAHQAAEKALKAALISMHFQRTMDEEHDLKILSEGMSYELKEQAEQLEELVKSEESMRYPSSWRYPSTPRDEYSKKNADDAIAMTLKIFKMVKEQYHI